MTDGPTRPPVVLGRVALPSLDGAEGERLRQRADELERSLVDAAPRGEPPIPDGELLGTFAMGGLEVRATWLNGGRLPRLELRAWAFDTVGRRWPARAVIVADLRALGDFVKIVGTALDRAEEWVVAHPNDQKWIRW